MAALKQPSASFFSSLSWLPRIFNVINELLGCQGRARRPTNQKPTFLASYRIFLLTKYCSSCSQAVKCHTQIFCQSLLRPHLGSLSTIKTETDLSYGSWKWWQSLFFLQCQGSKKAKKSSAQEPDIPAALTRILTKRPATYLPYEETRPAEYSNREQYLF